MCFVATIPHSLSNVKNHQTLVLTTHCDYDACTSTRDNLINDMCPFLFVTGCAENETFHLYQMFKQEDKKKS